MWGEALASVVHMRYGRESGGIPQEIAASTPRNAILAHIKTTEGSNLSSEVTDPEMEKPTL